MKAKPITVYVALLLMTLACNRAQPEDSGLDMKRVRAVMPGATEECLRKIETGGFHAIPAQTDECFKMLPAQHWRGLWRNDFEGSIFCSAPARTCADSGPDKDVWLTPGPLKGTMGATYEVEFIGRRTSVQGHYGHMGMSAHEIIVDRPISIRMITAPPPAMTKAELVAFWRRCEAAHTCVPSKEMRALLNGSK